jgi:hypothetical protein
MSAEPLEFNPSPLTAGEMHRRCAMTAMSRFPKNATGKGGIVAIVSLPAADGDNASFLVAWSERHSCRVWTTCPFNYREPALLVAEKIAALTGAVQIECGCNGEGPE